MARVSGAEAGDRPDECGRQHAGDEPVADLLHTPDERFEFLGAQVDLPVCPERVEGTAELTGQVHAELQRIQRRSAELPGPGGGVELTGDQALRVRPEDVPELKPGVQVRAHAFGHHDHLEEQGELVRDREVVVSQDRQDVAR